MNRCNSSGGVNEDNHPEKEGGTAGLTVNKEKSKVNTKTDLISQK